MVNIKEKKSVLKMKMPEKTIKKATAVFQVQGDFVYRSSLNQAMFIETPIVQIAYNGPILYFSLQTVQKRAVKHLQVLYMSLTALRGIAHVQLAAYLLVITPGCNLRRHNHFEE